MITAASIVFLLAFVALGARPYRVAPPLPPCEEVAAMPATIYAGNSQDDYVASATAGYGSQYVTREGADEYFREFLSFPVGVRIVDRRRVK